MKKIIQNETLTAIANAIRAKTGKTALIKPEDMPDEISGISGSGTTDEQIIKGTGSIDLSGQDFTKIRDHLFYNTDITGISLPDTCTEIGDYAFYRCNKLTEFDLSGIQKVGMCAFNASTSVEIINCSDLISVEKRAFSQSGIKTFEIPTGLTNIDEYVFYSARALETVTFHDNVQSIGTYAFSNCQNLKKIELPNSITSIGARAFAESGIKEITINGTISENSDSWCHKCSNLIKAKLKHTCSGSYKMQNLFYSCSALKGVWISKDLENIGCGYLSYSPFYYASSSCGIYLESESKPDGFEAYWNYCQAAKTLTVYYGITEEDFDAIMETK